MLGGRLGGWLGGRQSRVQSDYNTSTPTAHFQNSTCLPACLQVLPEMLRSATLAAQKGMGPDEAYVRNMLGFVWGPLVDVIPKVGIFGFAWGLDGHARKHCLSQSSLQGWEKAKGCVCVCWC